MVYLVISAPLSSGFVHFKETDNSDPAVRNRVIDCFGTAGMPGNSMYYQIIFEKGSSCLITLKS
jgi:hypothetical protein